MFDRQTQYGTDTMSRGASNAQALTAPFGDQASPEVWESFGAEYDTMNSEAHPATGGSAVGFLLILIGLIVGLWFVHRSSSVVSQNMFGVNWLTFLEVTVMASAGILLTKAVFGRWHVRGVTPAVAAI